jgi:hypothetical protein
MATQAFDYMPTVASLSAEVMDLYQRVCTECADQQQNRSHLGMDWPEHGTLKAAFAAIEPETLALAARAINSAGHWGGMASRGEHWKFSHFADQTLRRGLGLPEFGARDKAGIGYEVHNGTLRVTCSTRESWTWQEIGPATPELFERIKAATGKPRLKDPLAAFVAEKQITAKVKEVGGQRPGWDVAARHYKVTLRVPVHGYPSKNTFTVDFSQGSGIDREPELMGVLVCLRDDCATYENAQDIDSLASDLGITKPSEALRMWKALERTVAGLKALLGDGYEELLNMMDERGETGEKFIERLVAQFRPKDGPWARFLEAS